MVTGNQLHDGRLYLYELASGATRTLEDTLGALTFTWSPDGGRIAYERIARDSGDSLRDLRIIEVATEEQRPLSTGRYATYGVLHGIGPVWSPDGESIVYQRCPTLGMCNGENHDVVLVWPDDLSADGTPREEIVPLVERAADGLRTRPEWTVLGHMVTRWRVPGVRRLDVRDRSSPRRGSRRPGQPVGIPGRPTRTWPSIRFMTLARSCPSRSWSRRPADAATPSPSPSAWAGLPAGPHPLLEGTDSGVPITVTIAAPLWNGEPNGGYLCWGNSADTCADPPDGAGIFAFEGREYHVYTDACHWDPADPPSPPRRSMSSSTLC